MKNDVLLVAKDGLVYVSHFVKEKQMAYKLNKRYSPKNVSKVEVSPRIINSMDIDLDEIARRNFGEVLVYFTRVLESNFLSIDLAYFYHNIKTLSIEDLQEEMQKDTVLAEYLTYENKIILYDDYLKAIYHELFHMASSITQNGKFYAGFSQGLDKNDIGYGLNEGYTELLYRRYFRDVSNFVDAYIEEFKIASYIEKIVGRRKMESLYLRADLMGLLKEMRKYLKGEELFDIISKIEIVSYLSRALNNSDAKNFSPELYLDYLRDIYILLFKAFVRKLKKEYKQNWMSNEVLGIRIDEFLEEDQIEVYLGEHYYPFVNRDDFVSIFNEYFEDLGVYLSDSKEENNM